jgi:addiction module HigA family antidote
MAIKLHPSMAVHPRPWLRRNVIEPYKLTVTEAADRLHVTRPAMSNLLNGKADLSPTMALRFEKAFGLGAETLLRMQTAHDLAEARLGEDRLQVERIAEAA